MDLRDASIHSRQQPQGIIMTTPPHYAYHSQQQQQHLHNNPLASNLMPNPPTHAFNSAPLDAGLRGHHQQQQQQNGWLSGVSGAAPDAEPSKRRRGRPRKYSPDATGLVLSANSQVVSLDAGASGSGQKEIGDVNGEGSRARRQRGRPPGSGKKQLDALGGAAGSGFTPHVIKILPKEDIVSKMVDICQEGPRTIVIISAFGAVSNATLRLPGPSDEGGTVCYEGCCDILSLSGPFFCLNYDGSRSSNNFELTVLLSSSDGKFSGGRVVGKLIAATTVQIIAASFIAEQKKSNGRIPPLSSPPPTLVSHMLTFGGSATANNGTAALEAATDSSDDNGAASGSHTHTHRPYNNSTNYPLHNNSMAMYQPSMGWGNSGTGNIHHNNNG